MIEDFFKMLLIILCAVAFACCATPKEELKHHETHTRDSVVVERIVNHVNPADSARLEALLECDERGRVIVAEYNQAVSDNAKLKFELNKNGKAVVKFKTISDTIYLKAKDTYINKADNVSKEVIKYKRYIPKWVIWYLIITALVAVVTVWAKVNKLSNPLKWFRMAINYIKRLLT